MSIEAAVARELAEMAEELERTKASLAWSEYYRSLSAALARQYIAKYPCPNCGVIGFMHSATCGHSLTVSQIYNHQVSCPDSKEPK